MRVPDEIRDCVVFIGVVDPATQFSPGATIFMQPIGTAFIVSLLVDQATNATICYLVTARHVAIAAPELLKVMRFNRKDGTAGIIPLGHDRWFFHDDPTVDIAVIPINMTPDMFAKSISVNDFGTNTKLAEKRIGVGDEVFIAGLFSQFVGSKANIPIVRMGNIAMMPEEQVPTSIGNIDAFLIEARSIGGISGSPAFVRETRAGGFGVGDFLLLGVMHGHWDLPAELKNDLALNRSAVNVGIAIVVPSQKILDILDREPLRVERENALAQFKANQAEQTAGPL
jgi:hypothetical protein